MCGHHEAVLKDKESIVGACRVARVAERWQSHSEMHVLDISVPYHHIALHIVAEFQPSRSLKLKLQCGFIASNHEVVKR